MAELAPYRLRLEAAIERSPLSKRQVGARLAEREELKDAEAGRRQLYKYLDKGEPTEPEPERAAVLAVILDAPELALVQPQAERRQARRAELEARVADLEAIAEATSPYVAEIAARVTALEQREQPKQQESGSNGP